MNTVLTAAAAAAVAAVDAAVDEYRKNSDPPMETESRSDVVPDGTGPSTAAVAAIWKESEQEWMGQRV
uniref:Uncharacterized protein n=1 Tax=Setaria digitata TaxID=48799 RepID=A0A915Q311_9BILA